MQQMMLAFFFLVFNLLEIGCLTTAWSYIDIRLVLLEIWRRGEIDPASHIKNYSQEAQPYQG